MIEKENKDRIADYHKETLKAKYEFLRIFVLLDLTVGTGIIGFSLKEEQKDKEIFLLLIGIIFFFTILVFVFKTIKEINYHLIELKKLKQ
jgi:hypothetical protein